MILAWSVTAALTVLGLGLWWVRPVEESPSRVELRRPSGRFGPDRV